MTSEEIKKAFDICCDIQGCTGCPILELGEQNGCGCKHNLFVSAIDLIAEQEKEIDGLKAENVRLKEEMSDIRKKTAEEFAKRICEMLWNLGIDKDGNRFSYGDLTSENVLYVAKQFGVDIDDRVCKENNIATTHMNKLVEQDAEIEWLKTDYAKLQEQFAQYQMASDKEIVAQVKQAQIDALNELKERIETAIDTYYNSNGGGYYLAEDVLDDIDLLIEGAQND